jgi:hypothetical protein
MAIYTTAPGTTYSKKNIKDLSVLINSPRPHHKVSLDFIQGKPHLTDHEVRRFLGSLGNS